MTRLLQPPPIGRPLAAALAFAICFVLALAPGHGQAQSWPAKPLTLIIPIASGSAIESHVRTIAAEAAKTVGQPIVVENRVGAGGRIGMAAMMKAPKDGYTIGMTFNGIVVVLATADPSFHIEPGKDYAPVIVTSQAPLIMLGHPSNPFRDIKGLIAYARANPGKLSVSGSSVGSNAHLGWEIFKSMTGTDMVVVNFQGEPPSVPSLLNGDIHVALTSATIAPLIASGKLIGIATTSSPRWNVFPTLPTVQESGVPGFDVAGWYGIVAPAGTPPEAVAKLNDAFRAAIANPDVRKTLLDLGITPLGSTADEMQRRIRSELDKVGPIIQKAGMKLN
jgi:tripartite-type tricarboxylate transporter receptor subunit TctC